MEDDSSDEEMEGGSKAKTESQAEPRENVEERASQEKETGVRKSESETEPREEESEASEAIERTFSNLLGLAHPIDPIHVVQFHIQYDEAFIQMCDNIGPCQPVLSSYPKNEEGLKRSGMIVSKEVV